MVYIPYNLRLSGQPFPDRNNLDCISVFFYDLAFVVCNQEEIVTLCCFGSCYASFNLTLPGFIVGNVITHLIYSERLVSVTYYKICLCTSALIIVYVIFSSCLSS